MSNIEKYNDNLGIVQTFSHEAIYDFENAIRKSHERASSKKTNPNHVKQKAGMDYVEFNYMRNQANSMFPIWSTKNLVIKHELIQAGWIVVQMELHWIDNGVPRQGVCAAAHRIAFKSGMDRIPENIVDLSNDVKAAVTDAMKKGFNTYMNISDDVYRNIEIENIDEKQKKIMYDIIELCDPSQRPGFYKFVDNNCTKSNFEDSARKLLKALATYQASVSTKEEAKQLYENFIDRFQNEFDINLK